MLTSRLRRGFGWLSREFRARGILTPPVGFPQAAAGARERRERYQRDGFVLGGPLLDGARVRRLRAEFERVFARREHLDSGVGCRRHADGEREFFAVYGLQRMSAEYEDVAREPRLVRMLRDLTGVSAFRVLVEQVQYKPARIGFGNWWHRDLPTFPLVKPYTAITAWIALDDATEETGCMHLVPGSHRWGEAWDIAKVWSLPELPQVYHGHAVRPVSSPVPAGWVHFHDNVVWHRSGENRTRFPRRAIAIHYIGADERYAPNGFSPYPELTPGGPMAPALPLRVEVASGGERPAA